jgi:hypothetical protein
VAAATGEVVHPVGDVGPVGQHDVFGAEALRKIQRGPSAVDGDDPGASRDGDQHRAEADATDPDHGDPLAARHAGAGVQGAIRGGEPAAQRGGSGVLDHLGHSDQVRVGGVQGDVLGEGTPVREAGLGLPWTDLSLATEAPFTAAAPADEGGGHPGADRPASNVGTHRDDLTDQLVPRNVRECNAIVMTRPGMPVTAAQTRRMHPHDHPTGRRHRIGDRPNVYGSPELVEHHRAHGAIVPLPLACWGTMTRWYAVEPADGGFFTSAPHVFRYSRRFAAPPEKVWASLACKESIGAWSATVASLNWLSPEPFGVGSTREVALAPGLARVRERFFRWDEGHGYSFAVYESNLPAFKRFAEDYEVEPDGSDGNATRFTWTVALEPKSALTLPFKPLAPVLKLAFGRMATDGEKYFART